MTRRRASRRGTCSVEIIVESCTRIDPGALASVSRPHKTALESPWIGRPKHHDLPFFGGTIGIPKGEEPFEASAWCFASAIRKTAPEPPDLDARTAKPRLIE